MRNPEKSIESRRNLSNLGRSNPNKNRRTNQSHANLIPPAHFPTDDRKTPLKFEPEPRFRLRITNNCHRHRRSINRNELISAVCVLLAVICSSFGENAQMARESAHWNLEYVYESLLSVQLV